MAVLVVAGGILYLQQRLEQVVVEIHLLHLRRVGMAPLPLQDKEIMVGPEGILVFMQLEVVAAHQQ
jgi:hypothetical protein